MKRIARIAPLLVLLGLGACLENEEEIVVHPDGSVTVREAAKGDRADLANGYPVPLDAGWTLVGEDAERWLQLVGADTGSATVQRRVGEVAWPEDGEGDEYQPRLVVERRFDSVADLPEWFAPAAEPYRTAFLRRTARLDVRRANGRTVYVFERTFHDRGQGPRDALTASGDDLPQDLREKLEAKEPITGDEWLFIEHVVRAAFADAGEEFARDAILGLYTKGDASLSPRAVPSILEAVREAAGATVALATIQAVYEANLVQEDQRNRASDEEDEGGRLLRGMEDDLHQAIREALTTALDREGVEESTRNAVLFGLEWGFTAYAHSDDIQDEKFRVQITLPGTLVAGNYDESEDGTARWEFEGEELGEHDVVLRAVSVLE